VVILTPKPSSIHLDV